MRTAWIVIFIVIAIVAGAAAKYVSLRNHLVADREAIRSAWAQVNVVLERRADLIPNLVETAKGYASHEREIFESVANARAALLNATTPQGKIQANSQLDNALGRLLAIAENYPQLRANENFLRLQDELAGTENRIAVERRKYNEAVQKYNTEIELFPGNIVAGLSGFTRDDAYFTTEPGAQKAPAVKF